MELLFLLLAFFIVFWWINGSSSSKKINNATNASIKNVSLTGVENLKAQHIDNQTPTSSENKISIDYSVDSQPPRRDRPVPSLEKSTNTGASSDFLLDGELRRVLESITAFRAAEIFDSLPRAEKIFIKERLDDCIATRDEKRRSRGELAATTKQKLVDELNAIDEETTENDHRFSDALSSKTREQLRTKAKELWFRKKDIIETLLPGASSKIIATAEEVELEEKNELVHRRRDLENLLDPFYQESERSRRLMEAAQTRERIRQREEADAIAKSEADAASARQRMEAIRSRVEARNIPYVVHFTPIANLDSIVQDGLLSRSCLQRMVRCFIHTDEDRADDLLDWISTSISYPNYPMFFKKRETLMGIEDWAALLIQPDVLWELECRYFITNAAHSMNRGYSFAESSSVDAFNAMFDFVVYRDNIPEQYTTDPQAEVMIRSKIPARYIKCVAVERPTSKAKLNYLEGIPIEVKSDLFAPRIDYERWTNFSLGALSDNKTRDGFL